ncbi:MAG: general secretion pathway protein GspB [Steroidobacteraceae bacterium]|jgi:general secretion pathway protein B
MSFILDALRKSEHQRQRQAGPYVAQAPLGRRSTQTPMVLVIVAVLLVVNLVVLILFLLRDDTPTVVEAPAQDAMQSSPAATPDAAPPPVASRPAVAMAPPPGPVQQVQAPAGVMYEAPPQREAPEPPPAYLLPEAEAPNYGPAPPQPSAPTAEALPLPLSMLPPQATAGLPPLVLELHVYSSDPTQRAVFINGRRYLEGDTINEGADLLAISSEGAVLNYRGQRFLLPRP